MKRQTYTRDEWLRMLEYMMEMKLPSIIAIEAIMTMARKMEDKNLISFVRDGRKSMKVKMTWKEIHRGAFP